MSNGSPADPAAVRRAALLAMVRDDYESALKLLQANGGVNAAVRAAALTVSVAVIGLAVGQSRPIAGAFAIVIVLLFAFLDGYLSWVSGQLEQRLREQERVFAAQYRLTADPDPASDPDELAELEDTLTAYDFGSVTRIAEFRLQEVPSVVFAVFGFALEPAARFATRRRARGFVRPAGADIVSSRAIIRVLYPALLLLAVLSVPAAA
jgi:hypothetical protein